MHVCVIKPLTSPVAFNDKPRGAAAPCRPAPWEVLLDPVFCLGREQNVLDAELAEHWWRGNERAALTFFITSCVRRLRGADGKVDAQACEDAAKQCAAASMAELRERAEGLRKDWQGPDP